MILLDTLAQFFLTFTHLSAIIPITLVGFMWTDRDTFYHAICLLFVGMLINVALKGTFKIPLSPALGMPGFAFPSGHMQASTVFYGWLAYRTPKTWFRGLCVVVLLSIAWAIYYCGYHNLVDLLGALGVAMLILYGYVELLRRQKSFLFWTILFLIQILMLYNYTLYAEMPKHAYMAYYGLTGLMVSHHYFPTKKINLLQKIIGSVLYLVIGYSIYHFLKMPLIQAMPFYISELPWLLIAAMMPAVKWGVRLLIK